MTNELVKFSQLDIKHPFITDMLLKPHFLGKQLIIRFKNNYGASIVYEWGDKRLCELAVLQFDAATSSIICAPNNWELTYDNPIAEGDVLRYQTAAQILEAINQIAALPSPTTKLIEGAK